MMQSLGGSQAAEETEQLILQGVTYPNSIGAQSTDFMGLVQLSYQGFPHIYKYKDKVFISASDGVHLTPTGNKGYVIVYDLFRGMVSDPIYTGLQSATGDIHHTPVLAVFGDKILFQQELSHGQNPMYETTSGANFDLFNWTTSAKPSAFGQNSVYPHIKTLSDGSLWETLRNSSFSFRIGIVEQYRNTNGTWIKKTDILNWADYMVDNPTLSAVAYHGLIPTSNDETHLWVSQAGGVSNDQTNQQWWEAGFYLKSSDGITWSNIDGSWSKNIDTSGSLTWAEMKANMLVVDFGKQTGQFFPNTLRFNSGAFSNGKGYLMGGVIGDRQPNLYVSTGNTWVSRKVVVSGYDLALMTSNNGSPFNNAAYVLASGSTVDVFLI